MKLISVLLGTLFGMLFSLNLMAQTHRYDCRIFAGNYEHYSWGFSIDHYYKATSNQSQMITMREELITEQNHYPSPIEEGEKSFRYTIMGTHDHRLRLSEFEFTLAMRFIPNSLRQNWILSKNIPQVTSDLLQVNFFIKDPDYKRHPMINMTIPADQEYFHFPVTFDMGKTPIATEFYNHQFSFQVECMRPGLMKVP